MLKKLRVYCSKLFKESDEFYRFLAIDPGTDTLGIAVFDMSLKTGALHLRHASTFKGERLSKSYPQLIDVHGDKVARLKAHELNLFEQFKAFAPRSIICEAPFLSRFPQAYAALVECQTAIRSAVILYDQSLPLETVDPMQAKRAVGASKPKGKMSRKGRATHAKTAVRDAVLKLDWLKVDDGIILEDLDEHAIDSIAVGVYKYNQIKETLHVGVI